MASVANIFFIWFSSFSLICLLGLQSQFVRDKLKMLSFVTSLTIGLCELVILKNVPSAGWIEMAAFVIGGPCGIVVSIILHDQFLIYSDKKKKNGRIP